MQWCTANAFLCCLSATTIKNACFTFLGSKQFVWCIFFCELRHSGFSPLCPWQILVRGCFCWALPRLLFCFVSLLDGEAHIWLGDLCLAFCVFLFVVVCAVDLPFYMTTGVNVDVILNCFFTCKDRASERDRPYQRKKKLCPNSTFHLPHGSVIAGFWIVSKYL